MRISFAASPKPAAQDIVRELIRRYGQCDMHDADYVVVVGGDGTALKALHATLAMPGKPVFAMRLDDSLGFLANRLDLVGLPERLQSAPRVALRPLAAEARDTAGRTKTIYGINEIALVRQHLQAAKLTVTLNGVAALPRVVGDGFLVATPIGSTGYNQSAGGPNLPLDLSLLALTGLAVSRHSHWANRVVDDRTIIDVTVHDPQYRHVRLETSMEEFSDLSAVRISCRRDGGAVLLREPA
jgi:NAD+ kinase